MKLSIGSRFLDHIEDMDARFARLKELGFDAMDFNLWQLHQPCYESVEKMEAYCKQARAAAEKNGIEIYQTHGPWPTDDTTPESRATSESATPATTPAPAILVQNANLTVSRIA